MVGEAEKKFWGCPELVENLIPFMDFYSIFCLTQVNTKEADVETLRDEKHVTIKPPLAPSPEKEVAREELGDEPVGDGFCGFVEIPHDFGTPDYDHDLEKVSEAEKIMSQTDRCCFCTFQCPLPNQQESGKRLFGILETLWDHIEHEHPLGFEWLG